MGFDGSLCRIASCRKWGTVAGVALATLALGVSGCALSSSPTAIRSIRALAHTPLSGSLVRVALASERKTASLVVTGAPLPSQHPFDVARYLGRPLYSVSNSRHEVALTFDDGPSSLTTPFIVRILQHYHAHGTFFFVGDRAARGPARAIVREVAGAGDDIGNHTWTHAELMSLSRAGVDYQIGGAQSALDRIDGGFPTFIRPRSGKFDKVALREATRLRLVLTLWSVDCYDTGAAPVSQIVHRATTGVKAGSIIDMHDRSFDTVVALSTILERLQEEGLHAVTLSQLLADSTPSSVVPMCFRNGATVFRAKLSTTLSTARVPSMIVGTVRLTNGVARYRILATLSGAGGVPIVGARVYLQTSKNGRTKWANTYRLTTDRAGQVSKSFEALTPMMRYWRWCVAASQGQKKLYSAVQEVRVR